MVLFVLTELAVTFSPSWPADEKEKPAPKHAPSLLPGVEPEMLSADYWIALNADADEVVMTSEDIKRFNEKVRNKKVVFKDRFGKPDPLIPNYTEKLSIGLYMNPNLPLDLPNTMPGDSLRVWLRSNIEYLYSRDFYNTRNATYNDEMKQEIVDAINIDSVPDVITRHYGIIVKRADMRLFPTAAAGFSETQWEMDYFQTTGIYIINPAAILYESADGDFFMCRLLSPGAGSPPTG